MAVSSKSKSFFFSVTQTIRLALWLDPLDLQLVNVLSFPSQEERSRRIRRSCGRSPIKSLLLALMGIKSYSNSPGVCAQERRLREGKVIATAEQKKKKKDLSRSLLFPCRSGVADIFQMAPRFLLQRLRIWICHLPQCRLRLLSGFIF